MLKSASVPKIGPAFILASALAVFATAASAQSTVRIGMTAADIPRTLGQPDQGFEGNRFTGNTMYEGLTLWDLSSADKAERRHSRPRDRMGGIADRKDQMDLQAAARREIP